MDLAGQGIAASCATASSRAAANQEHCPNQAGSIPLKKRTTTQANIVSRSDVTVSPRTTTAIKAKSSEVAANPLKKMRHNTGHHCPL